MTWVLPNPSCVGSSTPSPPSRAAHRPSGRDVSPMVARVLVATVKHRDHHRRKHEDMHAPAHALLPCPREAMDLGTGFPRTG
jgi:hypothetical protein